LPGARLPVQCGERGKIGRCVRMMRGRGTVPNRNQICSRKAFMNSKKCARSVIAALLCGAVCLPALGQEKAKDAKAPNENDMMAMMMELMKPGENHKLLAQWVGSWTYTVKSWMNPDPNAPPMESAGGAVFREAMGGRFVINDHTGKMQMPGPDGKMTDMDFKGMGIDGYDNARKKFVFSWI